MDLNHRPPGPEPEYQKIISAASGVAYGIAGHLFPLLKWTEVGRKFRAVNPLWGERFAPSLGTFENTSTMALNRRGCRVLIPTYR